MKLAPQWADDLTKQVCKDYKRWPATVRWYEHNRGSSSGVTYFQAKHFRDVSESGRKIWRTYDITVRAGTNVDDVRLVLLHELAHYILMKSKKGRRESHSLRFWRLAFELYEKYGVDLQYAYDREKHYKQKATWAYQERVGK